MSLSHWWKIKYGTKRSFLPHITIFISTRTWQTISNVCITLYHSILFFVKIINGTRGCIYRDRTQQKKIHFVFTYSKHVLSLLHWRFFLYLVHLAPHHSCPLPISMCKCTKQLKDCTKQYICIGSYIYSRFVYGRVYRWTDPHCIIGVPVGPSFGTRFRTDLGFSPCNNDEHQIVSPVVSKSRCAQCSNAYYCATYHISHSCSFLDLHERMVHQHALIKTHGS